MSRLDDPTQKNSDDMTFCNSYGVNALPLLYLRFFL